MKPKSKLHYYLYTFCRYFAATMILIYAFAKIIGTQFTTPLLTYDTPVGSLSGMQLTWFYFGYSHAYAVFIALSQMAAAFLLFFRKTVRLGSVLFLCIMANIIAVDIAFSVDFDAFVMAIILTGMGLFIFLSEFPLFIKYFIKEPSLYQKATMPNWVNKLHKIKFIYIPLVVFGFFGFLSYINNDYKKQNENIFYGVWQLEKGDTEFNKIYFEGNRFQTLEFGKTTIDRTGQFTFDTLSKTITLKSYPDAYLNKMYSQANFVIDTTKRETLFKGNFKFNNSSLTLKNDDNILIFKKIR